MHAKAAPLQAVGDHALRRHATPFEDDYEIEPIYTPNNSLCQSINTFGADSGSRATASRMPFEAMIAGSRPNWFETASRFARS